MYASYEHTTNVTTQVQQNHYGVKGTHRAAWADYALKSTKLLQPESHTITVQEQRL